MGSLKRSNKKSAIERQVDLFTQPLPLQEKNLKAEIIKEHKQRLKTIEQKNQLTELKQEQRKQKRKELQESYQEGPSTSTNSASPTLVETSYIKSFKNDSDKTIWETKNSHPYPSTVILLLDALNKSPSMFHLRRNLTSGSSLERLKGNRNGQLSLRVNDQWRLCFTWHIGVGAYNVEIVDYH
ncbi:MAG: type II toxin-antitoxin system RelE/ParE family toxin [Alphaproteobacteria bacterium]|nr:type II toxin-antitoxin system RelE/ParE family toxin [Alphaproteobacteria bacterium]